MSFTSDINKFIKKADRNIATVQRKAATQLIEGVIDDTPQDTGYAAANWQPGNTGGPVDSTDVAAAKAKALAAIARWRGGEKPLVFSNAAPYIFPLEFGDSKHQPAGMVRKNAKQWPRYVKRAAASVKK